MFNIDVNCQRHGVHDTCGSLLSPVSSGIAYFVPIIVTGCIRDVIQ